MIKIMRCADGVPVRKLSEREVLALVRKHGALIDEEVLKEGLLDRDEMEGLGWIEICPRNEIVPRRGDLMIVPARGLQWALVRADA